MGRKKSAVEKQGQKLLDNLIATAMYHGWQQDQGVGKEVDKAKQEFDMAKLQMEQYIAKLHTTNRNRQKTIRHLEQEAERLEQLGLWR